MRKALSLLNLLFTTIFLCIIALIISPFDGRGNLIHRIARFWASTHIRLGGIEVVTSGLDKITAPPYIFMCNHQSALDIYGLLYSLPLSFRWIAKRQLFLIPLFGWALKRAGHISIDRENPREALKAMDEARLDARVAMPAAAGLARYALAAAGPARVLVIRLDKAALDLALAEKGEARAALSARLAGLDAGREEDAAEVCARAAALARAMNLCGAHDMGGRALVLAAQATGQALASRLEAELGLKVERPHDPGVEKWAAAWGAAASAAERGRAAPSLRQGRLVCPAYAQVTARLAAGVLAVAAALMALAVTQTWRATHRWEGQARASEREAAAAFIRATGWKNVPPSVQALRSEVAKAGSVRAGHGGAPSCLVRWRDLMALAPPGCGVEFQSISIGPQGIALSMRAPKADAVWALQARARASGVFLPDAPVDARAPSGGEPTFKMDLRYKP